MKISKKVLSVTLSALMAASLLAGCGGNDTSSNVSAGPGGEDGVFTIA